MSKRQVWIVSLLAVATLAFFGSVLFYETPILMYHKIEPSSKPDSLTVTPATFEKQMEFLKTHNYEIISIQDYAQRLKQGLAVPKNAVVITFDDGSLDNFIYAFPILKKMGFAATIYMITDNIGKKGWLSEEDLRILDSEGIEIGSHTVSHAFLPNHNQDEIQRQLDDSKKALESILQRPVTAFSYPAGGVTDEAELLVRQAGYENAVTTNYAGSKSDPYRLRRIKIKDAGGDLFGFWLKTSGYYHIGKKRVSAKAGEQSRLSEPYS